MDDLTLAEQVKNGNIQAFRYLVNNNQKPVWHLVLRMVKQEQDAEDLCQDIFMRVHSNIRKYRGESKLTTWICSIAYNVTIDFIRKKKREIISHTGNLEEMAAKKPAITNPGIEMEKSDTRKIIHELLNTLPLNYRTVITLYHLEGFSYEEISKITELPEGSVKSYLHRGREQLRKGLLQFYPEINNILIEK